MPLLLIKGEYRVLGNAPDGDTVRFYADDPALWARVPQGVRVGGQAAPACGWRALTRWRRTIRCAAWGSCTSDRPFRAGRRANC